MDIVIFKYKDGSVPFLDWLNGASERDHRIAEKVKATLEILQEYGYKLRRPIADYLRDGIYELRIHFGRVNYRLFYSFCEDQIILLHGCTKEAKVPDKEIDRAVGMMEKYKSDPKRHVYGK